MGSALSSVKYTPDGVPYYTLNSFKELKKVDNGGYGTVCKGYGTIKGFSLKKQAVAIKLFNAINIYSEREIQILKTHTHPNIVQLFGVLWDGEYIDGNPISALKYTGYVMEFLELGSLHRVIYDLSETYDTLLINTWIRQIATGLQYLHKNGIIHRDVKPENILLAARDHLKLADFGLARDVSAQNTNTSGKVGTEVYRAPEIFYSRDYGPPADIYSLGVTIWEIVERRHPRGPLEMRGITDKHLSEIISKCLHKNVSERLSTYEIIHLVSEPKTILIIDRQGMMTVLSADRSDWTQLPLSIPEWTLQSGIVYLNEEIYLTFDGYKLGQNLKWIRLANMDIARWHVTCLEWSGYIWTFGGVDKQFNARKSVERYDPKTNKWTIMPEMIHPRSKTATAIWSDRIIVAGGRGTVSKVISTVECFNPEDGSWTELPNMPACLRGHSLVSYKNKIIAMGGIDDEDVYQNTVYELDPLGKNPTWKSLQPMKYPAAFFSGIVLGDKIYKIGGYQGQKRYLDRVEIFDGEDWLEGPPLPFMWEFWMSAMSISQNLADSLCNHRPR